MPILVQRLEVQEGFLDGLDLRFTPGLNVLIGARGSGKTSVIELLRFGLAVRGYTHTTDERARTHAAAVLQSGRVTVTLLADGEEVVVTRAAEEDAPRILVRSLGDAPILLSQGEIERVGLDPAGRLRLIDGFRSDRKDVRSDESGLLTRISSLTVEMAELSEEINARLEEVEALESYRARLTQAEVTQQELVKKMASLEKDQEELERLSKAVAETSSQESVLERNKASLQKWLNSIESLLAVPPILESWEEPGPRDPLFKVSKQVANASDALRMAIEHIQEAISWIEQQRAAGRDLERKNRDASRELRQKLEKAQSGAGKIARDIAELRERVSRLEAIKRLVATNRRRIKELQDLRGSVLDELEDLRAKKFQERETVAQAIRNRLKPPIDIQVSRFGLHDEYASAVAHALRGSQLQYNVLAYRIADSMSPREFVEVVEAGDEMALANATEIEESRAARAVSHLSGRPLNDVLASRLEDSVDLRLFDGDDYKETERLSTGQRCTVILPIILLHEERPVVVDQPEDNLDNAFIVDTLLKAIQTRSQQSQLIFATHNPNIPVLGDASNVVLMSSDGTQGFVDQQGALNDPPIVHAITDVMEGGEEAFRLRAAFYSKLSVE